MKWFAHEIQSRSRHIAHLSIAGNYVEWKLEESLRSGEHFMRREVQLWNIPIFCSISYLCLVFFGKKYMANRQK